jgi:hypothetical protein
LVALERYVFSETGAAEKGPRYSLEVCSFSTSLKSKTPLILNNPKQFSSLGYLQDSY